MKNSKEDQLHVLRKISKTPDATQRQLANELGFSLGKLNYCLNALKEKGLIKAKNFAKNPNKIDYLYILTGKGLVEKTTLTINFMKRKMIEYDELKSELENKVTKKQNNIKKKQNNINSQQ